MKQGTRPRRDDPPPLESRRPGDRAPSVAGSPPAVPCTRRGEGPDVRSAAPAVKRPPAQLAMPFAKKPEEERPSPIRALLLGSKVYEGERGERRRVFAEEVVCRVELLADHGGLMPEEHFAQRAGIPAWRVGGAVAMLAEWLNLDGYPVIVHHSMGRQVRLDLGLLARLFGDGA